MIPPFPFNDVVGAINFLCLSITIIATFFLQQTLDLLHEGHRISAIAA
jgi:hypothetical protein